MKAQKAKPSKRVVVETANRHRIGGGTRRVLNLLADGRWHGRHEIEAAAGHTGQPALGGMRRLRELRSWFAVEKKALPGRVFKYRLSA